MRELNILLIKMIMWNFNMKNDPIYLFSNEKASLGILSADGNFAGIISENMSKVNFFIDKIFCKAFVILPYVNLKNACEEAYIRLLLGMDRFRSCVIVDEKVIKEECKCQM